MRADPGRFGPILTGSEPFSAPSKNVRHCQYSPGPFAVYLGPVSCARTTILDGPACRPCRFPLAPDRALFAAPAASGSKRLPAGRQGSAAPAGGCPSARGASTFTCDLRIPAQKRDTFAGPVGLSPSRAGRRKSSEKHRIPPQRCGFLRADAEDFEIIPNPQRPLVRECVVWHAGPTLLQTAHPFFTAEAGNAA